MQELHKKKEHRSFKERLKHIINFLNQKQNIWLLFLVVSIIITGFVFLLTSEQILLLGRNILLNPTILFFNILPVFLFLGISYFLSGKTFFSITLTSTVFLIFAIVDKIKVTMRQEPLLPADFTLAKEAFTIVKTFPPVQLFLIAFLIIALFVAIILSFRLSKNEAPTYKIRILGFALFLLIGYGSNAYWFTNRDLYNSYPVVGNPFFTANEYNSKGLIYSFCHQFNITRVTPPTGYDKATYDQIEANHTSIEKTNAPHIIMIMGEAFSDLSDNPNLDFTNYTDPLETFKEMSNSEDAISGKIVVPGFGGGTSNTEYDVLTACSTRYLNNPLPSYSFIHEPFDALPYRLSTIGYETLSIHPGYKWFYNRQNVYPDLGFQTSYFLEDSFDLSTQGVGGYINETATMDKIIETFDTHVKTSDTPLFSFTVTIQNHGPYDNRYGALPQNFDTKVPLTASETDLLTQYFKGIADADKELKRLRDYAANSEEPIVIVYFGDHLPGFSNGMEFFDLLDYPIDPNGTLEERLALNETPFLIWENDVAKEDYPFSQTAKEINLPSSGIISASTLVPILAQLLEMEGLSPLYDYTNDIRSVLPANTTSIFMDMEGNYTETPTAEQNEIIANLSNWQYYKLFDQTVQK